MIRSILSGIGVTVLLTASVMIGAAAFMFYDCGDLIMAVVFAVLFVITAGMGCVAFIMDV